VKNDKTKIADIAKALGISIISVSRALSGQSGVSSELRDRIMEKAREMGYVRLKSSNDLNFLVLHQKPY
jgi:LacI family transcriptional regulator